MPLDGANRVPPCHGGPRADQHRQDPPRGRADARARSGIIGLPLRLLAREIYDRIVALRGPSVVALVTGEERIVPPRAAYWVCTVEAMPVDIGADFLAVDEIQLAPTPNAATSSPTACSAPAASRRRSSSAPTPCAAASPASCRPAPRGAAAPLSLSTRASQDEPHPAAQRRRRLLDRGRLRDRRAPAPPEGRRRHRHRRALPAHPQRPGRDVPERRGRPPRRHRRHRHGPQPRHQSRRLLRRRKFDGRKHRQLAPPSSRRSPAAPAATPPTAPSASPARRRRSTPRRSRRSRTTASIRSPPALAQHRARLRHPRGPGREPRTPPTTPTCIAPARPTTSPR